MKCNHCENTIPYFSSLFQKTVVCKHCQKRFKMKFDIVKYVYAIVALLFTYILLGLLFNISDIVNLYLLPGIAVMFSFKLRENYLIDLS